MKWGLEVRELTLDCQGCQGNDASIIYAQDFLCRIIGTHILILRPELRAIRTRLSHETLNMQSPVGVNPGGAKEALGLPHVSQSIYPANTKLELNLSAEISWD